MASVVERLLEVGVSKGYVIGRLSLERTAASDLDLLALILTSFEDRLIFDRDSRPQADR